MDPTLDLAPIPSDMGNKVSSVLHPLFDILTGAQTIQDDLVPHAMNSLIQKLKPLKDTESIFQGIPCCPLTIESLRRINSRRWLKDDILTVFTNIANFAVNSNDSIKPLCINTQQTCLFLQDPFDSITGDTELLTSFRSGDFSKTETRMSSILCDWFSSNRIRILTTSLSSHQGTIPSCILFLDFVGRNHYIVHEVVIVHRKNSYYDGIVTTYDHLFTKTGSHIGTQNVSIRRCLIAKFFEKFFC